MSRTTESEDSFWEVNFESVERAREIHHGAIALARHTDIEMSLKPGQVLDYAHNVLMMIIPGREIPPLEVAHFGLVKRLKNPKGIPEIEKILRHQHLMWFVDNSKDVLSPQMGHRSLAWQITDKLTKLPFSQEEFEQFNQQYNKSVVAMLEVADAEAQRHVRPTGTTREDMERDTFRPRPGSSF